MLHVFDRSCNLISEDGGVISLVTQEVGDGPFNLVLRPILFSSHVSARSRVMCSNGALQLGDLVVDTTRAKIRNPRPDWDRLRLENDRIIAQLPLLTDVLRSLAPTGGLAEWVISEPDSMPPDGQGSLRT